LHSARIRAIQNGAVFCQRFLVELRNLSGASFDSIFITASLKPNELPQIPIERPRSRPSRLCVVWLRDKLAAHSLVVACLAHHDSGSALILLLFRDTRSWRSRGIKAITPITPQNAPAVQAP